MSEMKGQDEEKAVVGEPSSMATLAVPQQQQQQTNLRTTISNTTVPVHPGPDPFVYNAPDGGFVAWSQVGVGIIINSLAWGYPTAFGVYQLYYQETLGLPQSQVAWIGSFQNALTFLICTVSGRLSDAGYIRHSVLAGTSLTVVGTFMTSLATTYWQIFLSQGVCTGLGLGLVFMPAVSVITSYFQQKKALALALAAMGTGMGSLIFPSTVQYLIPQIGFPWAVRCAGFIALAMSVLANVLIRPYLPPRKLGPLVEWDAFKEAPYLFFSLGAFFNLYALNFGFFYINVYARNIVGFSSVEAVNLLLITNGMSIPARPVVGYLADYVLGPINTYIIGTLTLSLMTYVWTTVKTRTGMYVFSFFFGFASGACQGPFAGAAASLTKDPTKMGTRFGMCMTICGFAALAGPPTAGALIDQAGGSFVSAQIWAGSVLLAGAACLTASRFASSGRVWIAKV